MKEILPRYGCSLVGAVLSKVPRICFEALRNISIKHIDGSNTPSPRSFHFVRCTRTSKAGPSRWPSMTFPKGRSDRKARLCMDSIKGSLLQRFLSTTVAPGASSEKYWQLQKADDECVTS